MTTKRKCPQCGAELPSEAPQGLCPKCLIKAGLPDGVGTNSQMPPGQTMAISPADLVPEAPTQPPAASSGIPRLSPLSKVRYFGDYEILEKIAHGGMGVVYKARQVSLNRVVALKMILSGHLASEAEVKRFHTEAEAAANLQHPNIVAIHEVGQHQGEHYFSMDYVEGVDLARHLAAQPIPLLEAAQLVATLAEAVHYAHQHGTLHRDLKPQNVLIDKTGRPRITDFGLAKRVERESELTRTGAVMGSPSYMPPEQATGQLDRIGPSSDVYALGAILYELLTGRPPFRGESPLATLQQVLNDEPVAPAKHNPKVPTDLETICLKCLEKQPERRYVSARELAEELGRFLKHEPILARPASSVRKVWTWLVRNPWLLMGATAVAMLGLIALAYGLWEQTRYLVWTQTHATTAPTKPGAALSYRLRVLEFLVAISVAPTGFSWFVGGKRRGVVMKSWQLWSYGGLGAFLVLGAIAYTLAGIHDWIWRLDLRQSNLVEAWLFWVYTFSWAWFGWLLLFYVAREYRIRSLGLQPANEAELFPPVPPETSKDRSFNFADRQGLNWVLGAVLVVVWLFRFLFPSELVGGMCLFAAAFASSIPFIPVIYRFSRKSAVRHIILLWLTVLAVAFGCFWGLAGIEIFGEAKSLRKAQLTAALIGLGLGAIFAAWLTRALNAETEEDSPARKEAPSRTRCRGVVWGAQAPREEAEFEWIAQNPHGIAVRVWGLVMAVSVMTALIGGMTISINALLVTGLLAVLPHTIACWLRATGQERQGRQQTIWLFAISALSAAWTLSPGLAASSAGAGLLQGLAVLAVCHAKSKNLARA